MVAPANITVYSAWPEKDPQAQLESIRLASARLVMFARHYESQNVLPTALFSMAYINGREERLTFGDLYRLADAVERIQKL